MIARFFYNSEFLDYEVLRPMSHMFSNWELSWDCATGKYKEEEESFAAALNQLIAEIGNTTAPKAYHDNEDCLAEHVRDHLGWKIYKRGQRWYGCDYRSIVEQGGFHDEDQKDLISAAAGRIAAATKRGQLTYDEMEESHRLMLATVMQVILYHRSVDIEIGKKYFSE